MSILFRKLNPLPSIKILLSVLLDDDDDNEDVVLIVIRDDSVNFSSLVDNDRRPPELP